MAKTAAKAATATKKRYKRRDISLPKFQQKRGAGRPPIYEAEAHCARATKLSLLGLNDAEIAEQFGIAEKTLILWKADHPEFCQAINAGKVEADAEMAQSLFNRGRGMKLPAVKIFYDKDKGEPVYAPYVEHLPPDTHAAVRWLTNRQPGRWKERREVEMTVTLEQQIAQLTPEERRQRLIELQAKASGMLIEGEATEVEPDE